METLWGALSLLPEKYSFFVELKKTQCPVVVRKATEFHSEELVYENDGSEEAWQSVVPEFA